MIRKPMTQASGDRFLFAAFGFAAVTLAGLFLA